MSDKQSRVVWVGLPEPVAADAAFRLPDKAPWGPFAISHLAGFDGEDARKAMLAADAVLVYLPSGVHAKPIAWASLAGAAAETALVVVSDEMDATTQQRLLNIGVQDVVLRADGASLAQRARLASQRKQLDDEARKAYATDLGTGLPNRQQFIEHMSQILALREREPRPVSVLVFGIEGLRGIEMGHGEEAANVVRRKLAVRLRAGVRSSDLVASLGADQFAVLLPSMESADDAQHVVAKLVQSLREPIKIAGADVPVRAHVGIAQFPQDGAQPDQLLSHAAASAQAAAKSGQGAANDY